MTLAGADPSLIEPAYDAVVAGLRVRLLPLSVSAPPVPFRPNAAGPAPAARLIVPPLMVRFGVAPKLVTLPMFTVPAVIKTFVPGDKPGDAGTAVVPAPFRVMVRTVPPSLK